MADTLLNGEVLSEDNCNEEFQKSVDEDERDESMKQDKNHSSDNCSPVKRGSILRRADHEERPRLKKRVSFDKVSIERKRGKVSRRPRRRQTGPVTTPLRDFIALMATFLLTALLSSLLRDQQRQAQQNYLKRKTQAKQKGGLSSRRKQLQQQPKIQLQQDNELDSIMHESPIVSSDILVPIKTQSQQDILQDIGQILESDSSVDNIADSEQELPAFSDDSSEVEVSQSSIPNEGGSSNSDNPVDGSHPESSFEASSFTESTAPPTSHEGEEIDEPNYIPTEEGNIQKDDTSNSYSPFDDSHPESSEESSFDEASAPQTSDESEEIGLPDYVPEAEGNEERRDTSSNGDSPMKDSHPEPPDGLSLEEARAPSSSTESEQRLVLPNDIKGDHLEL